MFAGPCSAATILICSFGMAETEMKPIQVLILFRNLPSAIRVMSYTCSTCAGFFANGLNSLTFQSDFVYTNWPSAVFTAPIAASAAKL